MNQRIRDLRDLSAVDTELRELSERRQGKVQAIETAEAELAEAEGRLSSKREEIGRLHREVDALNLELQSAEEHAGKLDTQRNSAKSNKEYEVFTREIAAENGKVSGLEDKVLALLEVIDALSEQEKAASRRLDEATAALEAARGELARAEGEFASKEAVLQERRSETSSRIDPDDLELYDRMLIMRRDSATSAVENGICRACARKLTPQTENLVILGEDVVQCMSCSRILYAVEVET